MQDAKNTIYPDRFKGQTVLITGAAGGIGKVTALRFAREGASKVLISDYDKVKLAETEKEIAALGVKVESYICNVASKKDVDQMFEKIFASNKKLEILVHCAGVAGEKAFVDLTEDEWLRTININLNGTFYVLQPVVRHMIANKYGKIVNITSVSGIQGSARPNRTPYSASKFGQNGLTQALALEVAKYKINVNAVCPSRIESLMTEGILQDRMKITGEGYDKVRSDYEKSVPIGRLGWPEDVAATAAFLATEEASYITGQFFLVSGGR